jgi:hypothetical protein
MKKIILVATIMAVGVVGYIGIHTMEYSNLSEIELANI